MSFLQLPQRVSNLKRLREIAIVLARHGFSHFLSQLRLADYLPGFSFERVKAAMKDRPEDKPTYTMPERVAMVMQELGATFIKFGQLLATRPDLVPVPYVEQFKRLQDHVEPQPAEVILRAVRANLGGRVDDHFASFDEVAVASGSIGQVHFATLHDGTRVVVKVKREYTDRRVREDLDLLATLADLVEKHVPELRILRPRMLVDEFTRLMEREVDFVSEAASTENFGKTMRDQDRVYIPRVFWKLVTRDVLVLERMSALRLTNRDTFAHPRIDRKAVAKLLSDCFMRQYFVTGLFHADPHPGNIFLPPGGGITLIDFGQIGRISDELRQQLAVCLIALTQGDTDFMVDVYAEIGILTEETNLREFRSELSLLINRYYGIPVDRLDMGEAFQEIISVARKHGLLLPRDFVLLAKSFITVTGVIQDLDPEFRMDEAVQPFLGTLVRNMIGPKTLLRRLGVYGYRMVSLLQRIPEDVRDLLEKLRAGRTRIIFHHEGLNDLTEQIERASNRLTVGVLIAAIIVGSSIVMAAGPGVLGAIVLPYFGQTPVAMLLSGFGFVSAMILGFWLIWSILRGRRL